jgi:hypothetical protein
MKLKNLHSVGRILLCCLLASLITIKAKSQDGIDKVFQNGKADGEYLLRGYLSPFMKTIGVGLNQGWYNTAKTHKVAGLDLTITVSPVYFPTSDLNFYVDNSKLTYIERVDGTTGLPQSGNVPTMFGANDAPHYQPKGNPTEKFEGPPGIDLKKNVGKFLPVPMATLGFGLPKSIEVRVRFCPSIDLGDKSKFNLFGIGVMHDIKQYIPGIKLLPFDLSIFAGYTHMQMKTDLSGNFGTGNQTGDQLGVFSVNSTTIQAIISKKVSVITVYGSIGYNIAKSTLAMKGPYDFNSDGQIQNDATVQERDPVSLDFTSSGPRVSGGVRLKLWVFTFHGDYTLQKYNSLSAGFGINIR